MQVLLEFHVNFVRRGHSIEQASLLVGDFTSLVIIDNSLALFERGLSLQSRWQLSLWDALILAAAENSGARELLSEDLNHGQDYGGVRVRVRWWADFGKWALTEHRPPVVFQRGAVTPRWGRRRFLALEGRPLCRP